MRRAARVLTSGIRGSLIATIAVGCLALTPATANANSKYSGIVVDAKTGKTLYSYKADTKRYPASLTKIMTLYMLFEELEAGRMSLRTPLKVSKYAASRPPSKLGLKPGSTISAKDAILALVTKSANDVAVVVADVVLDVVLRVRGVQRRQVRPAHLPRRHRLEGGSGPRSRRSRVTRSLLSAPARPQGSRTG